MYRTVRATFFMFNFHLLDYFLTEKFILQFCLHLNLNQIPLHSSKIGKEKLFPSLLLSFVLILYVCVFVWPCTLKLSPNHWNECSLYLLRPILFPSEVDRSSTNNFPSIIQRWNGQEDERRGVPKGLNRKFESIDNNDQNKCERFRKKNPFFL